MPSLREQLIGREWKQGSIIDPGSVDDANLAAPDAFLILNQTCDLLAEKIDSEPHAELLPLTRIERIDSRYEGGKNSRKIHFQTVVDGEPVCVEGSATARVMLPREKLLDARPSTRWSVSPQTVNKLLVWFTRRYLRTAFPDAFEARMKPVLVRSKAQPKGIIEVLKPHHSLIDTLFLRIKPLQEVSREEPYELRVVIAADEADMEDPAKLDRLHSMANQLGSIFEQAQGFELDGPVMVESLNKISLAQQRDYLIWERYDYLSFGEDD